jgi:phosphonate transport system substrate-binding protein
MGTFYLLAVSVAALALTSCDSGRATARTGGRPSLFRYAYSVTYDDPDTALQRIQPLKQYLENTLHMPVEMVETTNYGVVIEAFRAHKIDAASISPFSYVLATQKAPIEAIVMHGGENGGPAAYTGSLGVPANSPIHSMQDVIKHAKELTISFVDPASASGFLVQNAYLQSLGIDPQKGFRKVLFTQNHLASVMTLKAGKVDVGAVNERMLSRWVQSGKLKAGDIRILWTSPSIPNQPIAVIKTLPAEFKEELRRVFLDLYQKDRKAFEAQVSKTFAGLGSLRQPYVRADDSMFDGLRQMARNVPNLSLLEQ